MHDIITLMVMKQNVVTRN